MEATEDEITTMDRSRAGSFLGVPSRQMPNLRVNGFFLSCASPALLTCRSAVSRARLTPSS
jgi:hypothetical protein